jgi:nucleotide-binding universal stress UspA family protein
MYRSIMLPLDGSAFGEQAIPIAATLASRCGAQLKVVHVHERSSAGEWELLTPYRFEGVEDAERDWEGEDLKHEQEYLARHAAGAECKVLEGPVVPSLEKEIAESNPDLIVMATHARGGLSRALVGSVADRLIRDVHKPILLIRVPEKQRAAGELKTDHILVPLDGSAMSTSVLQHALSMSIPSETRITLLRVVSPPYAATELAVVGETDVIMSERVEAAHEYLNGIATELGVEGYLVDTDVVISSMPADAILHYAQDKACDVICMATHGRSGVRRMLMGSVASSVLHSAKVPVLLYRP